MGSLRRRLSFLDLASVINLQQQGSPDVQQCLSLRRRLSFDRVEFLDLASKIDFQEQVAPNVHQGLTLVKTLDEVLQHVPNMNSFAVSSNGDIAIASQSSSSFAGSSPNEASPERSAEEKFVTSPSLSLTYPGWDIRPFVLSSKKEYWSPTFVGNDNQLATTCGDDNGIRLWNITDGTSKIVYNCRSNIQARKILCVIDRRTVACHTMVCTANGQNRIEDPGHKYRTMEAEIRTSGGFCEGHLQHVLPAATRWHCMSVAMQST